MYKLFLIILFLIGTIQVFGMNDSDSTRTFVGSRVTGLLKGTQNHIKADFINHSRFDRYATALHSENRFKLDSIVTHVYSESIQNTEKSMLRTYRIDGQERKLEIVLKSWDPDESKWKEHETGTFLFDGSDRLVRADIVQVVTKEYSLFTRIDYTYENGLLATESHYDRIDEMDHWNELKQLEYTYNENGKVKTVYTNKWENYVQAWETVSFEKYHYSDSTGNLELLEGFDYDSYSLTRRKKYEERFTYDGFNNLVEKVEYIPGWEEDQFIPEFKTEQKFESDTLLKSRTRFNWSYDHDDWLPFRKSLFGNTSGDELLQEQTDYMWENGWKNLRKTGHYSESDYRAGEIADWDLLTSFMPVYSFAGRVCDYKEVNVWQGSNWTTDTMFVYFFSEILQVDAPVVSKPETRIYPVPARDFITVEVDSDSEILCTVSDLAGRKLVHSSFYSRQRIDVSFLPGGVYVVEVYVRGQKQHVAKVIKQ